MINVFTIKGYTYKISKTHDDKKYLLTIVKGIGWDNTLVLDTYEACLKYILRRYNPVTCGNDTYVINGIYYHVEDENLVITYEIPARAAITFFEFENSVEVLEYILFHATHYRGVRIYG